MKTENVVLEDPIEIDGKPVKTFVLQEPTAGQLRGVRLAELLTMEPNVLIRVIPRIVQPHLTEDQAADLKPAQLMAFAAVIVGFFASAQQKADAGLS